MDGKQGNINIINSISREAMENVFLSDLVFRDNYVKELEEIEKHEIIVKIADIIGSSPSVLQDAEDIFESIKYIITDYVVQHEFSSTKGVDTEFLLWLDSKINPGNARKLKNFISHFFK